MVSDKDSVALWYDITDDSESHFYKRKLDGSYDS